jgi:homogentisate 1,2-dioxygenase
MTTEPTAQSQDTDGLRYMGGFGNSFESECLPGALPIGRNNPRTVPFGLYTEQLSGTAFTAPRAENKRTWLYRIQPSVAGLGTARTAAATGNPSFPSHFGGAAPDQCRAAVDPIRWKPMPTTPPSPKGKDFVRGMHLQCHAGDPATKNGVAIYMYDFWQSMSHGSNNTHLMNSDGDFLIVPQQGVLEIVTEMGRMIVAPTEIAVVPRGIVFQVNLWADPGDADTDATTTLPARGYMLEVYNASGFQLPERGLIGSNGLANDRDFLYPTAACIVDQESYRQSSTIWTKCGSKLFEKSTDHSPFNVVAWHGNYLPYKYNLKRFCAVGSVSFDHLDPSIYTVLTCPTDHTGTAMCDFVIFPPRILASDSNTLRPPWFHRNTMSEYMGLIEGEYDAKVGFQPGGASLHNCMVPHGPDSITYQKAVADPCAAPVKFEGGLAFMFETCLELSVSPVALGDETWREMNYAACWDGLEDRFTGWDQLNQLHKKK